MSFSSINIQGNIISSEILDKIRSEDKFKHQLPEAFGLARTASLRDEIGLSWALLRSHWQAYKKRLENLPKGDTGTSLTREKWITPLLSELGYAIGIQKAQLINGKSYAISHTTSNKGDFPIHIMGYNDDLDKRRDVGGPRLSPHALVQEYLNNTEHLYGIVTNGRHLRLLRDATRLVRMSYLEFDLERMFEEELYADFSLLYRVLHVSRMPVSMDTGADSPIEFYHQESLASGTRIREKLSEAVEDSIKRLANGFLQQPKNNQLISLIEENHISANTYYMHQLRLIYRVLFLVVLEERKLIYPDNLTEEQQRLRSIYYKYYSIERLRKLTENRVYIDADKYDIWESLKATFLLFEFESYGSKLGIKPLASGLFAPDAIGTLKEQFLSNGNLIEVIKRLTTFTNEQGQLVRVNYSDLDVEEFGSVYEGLLEYDPKVEKIGNDWQFSFVEGKGRSSSGSHYTPEELVKPLIKHSLDYIIADKLKEPKPEEALLSITVCDVACGSGHILLSAARRIATELASLREGAEQPSPTFYRSAIRDVIRHCIYGVDKNPLAVELCKVALWLEAHNPNEPLNFLDHHIKCGDAIVGLAHREELENGISDEAFKTLPGDDKDISSAFSKKNKVERKERITKELQIKADFEASTTANVQEAMEEYKTFNKLSETTPEEIEAKQHAYKKFLDGKGFTFLKTMADTQVAQFFIPKTTANKDKLITDNEYRQILAGQKGWQGQKTAMAAAVAQDKRIFHWFLEFPEVFQNGGFNCILGNPPFLGGLRISKNYGNSFLNCIQNIFHGCKGTCDLVAYFFRRDFQILNQTGFISLISTNTISQGDTREGSLDIIINEGGKINFAIKSQIWPGKASVEVSLITISKNAITEFYIGTQKVSQINSLLDDQVKSIPYGLNFNQNKSFKGVTPLGKGFVLEKDEALKLLKDKSNELVIKQYLIGDDLNNNYDQSPGRYIIHFGEMNYEEASKFIDCIEIIRERVKPERDKNTYSKSAKEKWWLFERARPELYNKLKSRKNALVSCTVTKYLSFTFLPKHYIFDVGTNVITEDSFVKYSIFQSIIHESWARKYGSSLESRLRYTNEDCIENYPFPKNIIEEKLKHLEVLGAQHFEFRKELMLLLKQGLTRTYNLFHSKNLSIEEIQKVSKQDEVTCQKACDDILKLRGLHKQIDEAVLDAYGWSDIQLRHDFYEVEYLPENDRMRYTIHTDARKEVLKRLLELNHTIYEEEIKQGLHKEEDVKRFYEQKGIPVPAEVIAIMGVAKKEKKVKEYKSKLKKSTVNDEESVYKQPGLFEEDNLFSGEKEGND
ncbi:MAG: Eco57I restriction-modification methylase domain-containing protein [Bacteroidota bacterium]